MRAWALGGVAGVLIGLALVLVAGALLEPPPARLVDATRPGDLLGPHVDDGRSGAGGDDALHEGPSDTPRRRQEKRGIRPPWRENLIPELRRQPGARTRKLTA